MTIDRLELAKIIIDKLELGLNPDDVNFDAPLFGYDHPDSLCLDSIDALEIGLAVSNRYGVAVKANDENNAAIFANINSLAGYIETQL